MLGDFKEVKLRLNFTLKGRVSRGYLWTVRRENGYTTTLTLEVFTQRNCVAELRSIKIELCF